MQVIPKVVAIDWNRKKVCGLAIYVFMNEIKYFISKHFYEYYY